MGKKFGKESRADNSNHLWQQDNRTGQGKMLERFLAATIGELILAISELPDGIILEVYFDDEG